VSWVLGAIDKAQLKIRPVLGIVPLGTGNDLARVLGWGPGYDSEDITEVLNDLQNAKIVHLDRWRVNVDHSRFMGLRRPSKRIVMNNYFGIGCDACVTLNFHNRRESMPFLFTSRVINKAVFFGYGSKEVLSRSCKDLQNRLEVELDGVHLKLPELEGVVVLNINSWGAGVPVWGNGGENGFKPCRFDDGLVEVFAIYSSLHIARLQVSLAKPHRLGQAQTVRITLKSGWAPVHVDGEPWEQSPGTITISYFNQMAVLQKQEDVTKKGPGTVYQ
jgi:diacylglycerol kinase (ATP)